MHRHRLSFADFWENLKKIKKELILIRKYCIIILEKEEAGTGIPTSSKTTPNFKSGWSASKLCRNFTYTIRPLHNLRLGSGLFHYDKLHFIIKAMYHISSRNCLTAIKPNMISNVVIRGFTSFTEGSTNHSLAKCLWLLYNRICRK